MDEFSPREGWERWEAQQRNDWSAIMTQREQPMKLRLSDPGMYPKVVEVSSVEEAEAFLNSEPQNTTWTWASVTLPDADGIVWHREVGNRNWVRIPTVKRRHKTEEQPMQIDITSITVLTGAGTDRITLRTNLPPSLWPWTEALSLSAEVAAGRGEQYVRDNFPDVSVQVVDVNSTKETQHEGG